MSKNPEDYATTVNLSPSPYIKYATNAKTRSKSSLDSRPVSNKMLRRSGSISSDKVYSYLKKQKYTFAREIMLPSVHREIKVGPRFIENSKHIVNMQIKHEKEGFMRRNKLIL